MSFNDPLQIGKAAQTITAAVPAVQKTVEGAETALAADLAGAEKTIESTANNALVAFADGVTQVLAALDRLDGATITIAFSFPQKVK